MSVGTLPAGLTELVLDQMGVAVTVVDADGRILYYNKHASEILVRKPEMIGTDIRPCHKKARSVSEIDKMMEEFRAGREEYYHYIAVPFGKPLAVTVAPLFENGVFMGIIQTVVEK